ncbi:hypothetical protein F5X68DRAFT_205824 [Plectosphaerella plurivora]|uniref:Bromo domain-containing protein n=1 Tax=Plectosphaerella plurivora TaxID=936078 RepID=A0A9P8VDQ3_9PEZI|nr:hypothetical protein F5X68DRAFT_205824 [Plectosphaerella plurivora]
MSKFEAYTKLESWLLFRELFAVDAEVLSFNKAADFLAANEYVKEDPTFDPSRLTPDALNAYYLHLVAVEYGTAPAMPSEEEFESKIEEKVDAIASRLYNDYATSILVSVREDERRLNELAREIREEEMKEEEERKAKAAADARQAAAAAAAASQTPVLDLSLPPKPNGRKPSPPQPQATPVQAAPAAQVQAPHHQPPPPFQTPQVQPPPVQAPQVAAPQHQTPQAQAPPVQPPRVHTPTLAPTPAKASPQPSPQPPPQVATAPQQPPAQAPVAPRPVAPSPVPGAVQAPAIVAPAAAPAAPASAVLKPQPQAVATKAPNAPPQVLQPPMGVGQPPPRAIQSTSPAPLPAISPRPDAAKPKTPVPVAPAQVAAPGTLKWEKPYQPPVVPSQGRPVPPNISPAPQLAPGTPGHPQHPGQPQHLGQPQHPGQQQQQQHVGQPQHPGQQQHVGQPQHPQHAQHPGQPQHPGQWQQQHPIQQPHFQPPQAQGPQGPQTPQAAQAQRPSPVLMPPQPPSQLAPPMHAGAGRPVPPPQPRQASTTPIPAPVVPAGQARATPAQQPPPQGPPTPVYHNNRPIAAATTSKPPTPVQQGAVAPPPPRWNQQHAGQYTPSQFTPAPPPTHTPIQPATADSQRRVGSPYANQPPRPALPPHIASQLPRSPSPAQRPSNVFAPPKTPVASTPTFIRTGSGTKWKPTSTVSTPTMRPSQGDVPSPAFEPLSPVQKSSKLLPRPTPASVKKISPKPEKAKVDKVKSDKVKPEKVENKPTLLKATPTPTPSKETKATPSKEAKSGRPRGRPPKVPRDTPKDTPLPPPPPPHQVASFAAADNTPSRAGPSRRSQSIVSQAGDLSMDDFDELTQHVKDEAATPRPTDETGDTTADESGPPGRRHRFTPGSVSSRLAQKRKRQDSAPLDLPPPHPQPPASTPTHVLWTRQFGRISSSALDQISSHRCANQFAHAIRERDAPGYRGLVLQPQDIKSIRAAMTHGNRAAGEAAKGLPDGDPGTPMVWLPISDDLLPPKSIINSEQLERELVHMFSNAIMYNLDPHRGPGSAFLKRDADGDDDAEPSTYLVDEDAVVRDSRTMFLEVERLLGELRNAERKRSGNPPSGGSTGGGAAWAAGSSAAATPGGGESTPTAGGGQHLVDDDLDELAGEEGTVATVKRRRIGTRA